MQKEARRLLLRVLQRRARRALLAACLLPT